MRIESSTSARLPNSHRMASVVLLVSAAVLSSLLLQSPAGARSETYVAPFRDVPVDHAHASAIGELAERGITAGCTSDAYCPDDHVTRAQMATFLTRAAKLPAGPSGVFEDVRGVHSASVDAIAASGVTEGCTSRRFCPNGRVTRAQVASFLQRELALPGRPAPFRDVDPGSTHADAIGALAEIGILRGDGDGLYHPARPLTRAQMASVLVRAYSHAPVPGDPRVAVVGDSACDPEDVSFNGGRGTATRCRQMAVSDLAVGQGYQALITTGDNQYEDGRLSAFLSSYDPSWGRLKSITRPVPGNHEYRIDGAQGYFAYFGQRAGEPDEGWYSFDVGDWHVIALNSNCAEVGGCHAGSPQERWLRAELASSSRPCTLVSWHHPRWSSGRHGDSVAVAPLYAALSNARVDVLVGGHDHNYERFAPQTPGGVRDGSSGIRQFVVGTGGKDLRDLSAITPNSQRWIKEHGILELTLGSHGYDWRFIGVENAVLDSGTGRCVT